MMLLELYGHFCENERYSLNKYNIVTCNACQYYVQC